MSDTPKAKSSPLTPEEIAQAMEQLAFVLAMPYANAAEVVRRIDTRATWGLHYGARLLATIAARDEALIAERDAWVEVVLPGNRATDMGKEARAKGPSYWAGVQEETNALIRESVEVTANAYDQLDEMVIALRSEVARLTEKNGDLQTRLDCFIDRDLFQDLEATKDDLLRAENEITTKDEQIASLKALVDHLKNGEHFKGMRAEISSLEESRETLKALVRRMGETFREYEKKHRARVWTCGNHMCRQAPPPCAGCQKYLDKAEVNAAIARECEEMGK